MRVSEWIQGSCAIVLAFMAWIRPLPAGRRWVATVLAVFAIVAIGVARLSIHFLSPVQVSILRDWLPVVLMLVPYWQAGQFFLDRMKRCRTGCWRLTAGCSGYFHL